MATTSGQLEGSARISIATEALVWHLHGDGLALEPETGEPLHELFDDLGPRPSTLSELLARIAAPGDRPRLAWMVDAVASDRQPRACRHVVRIPDGRPLHLETQVFAEPDGARVVGVTRLREDELRLRREHADLAAVRDALPLTLLVFDRHGKVVHQRGKRRCPWGDEEVPAWLADGLRRAMRHGVNTGGGELRDPATGHLLRFEVRFTREGAPPGGMSAIVTELADDAHRLAQTGQSEQDLFEVLDTVADSISVMDARGRLRFINRAGLKTLGLRSMQEVATHEDQERLLERWEIFDDAGQPLARDELPGRKALRGVAETERLIRFHPREHPDDERWSLVRALPMLGHRGEVRMAVSVWTDVTDIQRARDQLRRQSAVLTAESEASLDAILVVSRDGQVLDFNKRFLDVWRMDPTVVQASDDRQLLDAATHQLTDPAGFIRRVDEIYREAETVSHDELHMRDGRVLERYSAPASGEDGNSYGRIWFFRDVTDRKRAEQRERLLIQERSAHAASERALHDWEFLANLSRALSGLLEVDAIVAHVARAAVPRLGVCCVVDCALQDGTLSRTRLQLPANRRPDQYPALRDGRPDPGAPIGVGAVLRDGRLRVEPVAPPGSPRPGWSPLGEPGDGAAEELRELGVCSVVSVPLIARGKPFGVLSFCRTEATPPERADLVILEEVSQRAALSMESARLYQRAQDAIAARDDFLSVAAHELRTPLTALRLLHQSLARLIPRAITPPPEQVTKLLATADAQDHRLGRLIDSLLDVTRIQGRKLELDLQQVDLSELARTTAASFHDELERNGQPLVLSATGPVVGRWDRARLEQVLTNLLSNAIKYGAGKPIEVEVLQTGEQARLRVRDHGIGIPADQQGQIFERFERAVSSRHYGGLGLGLYIVRGIVQRMGGTVGVESEPGVGTTFTVELPMREGA